jgi:8-oxo-dGTP pyrophosphatase MutT (NUDIX family)
VWLEPAKWYATLPSFLASAGALVTDASGAVLIVKPNYRPHWNLPGGVLNADEPPHLACSRELIEELGIVIPVGKLLVVDWSPPTDISKAWFGFIFDGGTLGNPQEIRLQTEELDAYEFVPANEAYTLLTLTSAGRLRAAIRARTIGKTINLHAGVEVVPPSPPPMANP